MVDRIIAGLRGFKFKKMNFEDFMSSCTGEVDPSINTQLFDNANRQVPVGFDTSRERQCCGEYPKRRPFIKTETGNACCNNKSIFDQKFSHCCPNGNVVKIGEVCW